MNKKVLIVEDKKPIARALSLKLTKSGFEADVAYNGEEALLAMEGKQYDLILMDLVMPRMSGFALLEQMKTKGITVPVIVLSNLGQHGDIERAKQYGVVDYFVKADTPIVAIVNYVNKALGQ